MKTLKKIVFTLSRDEMVTKGLDRGSIICGTTHRSVSALWQWARVVCGRDGVVIFLRVHGS